MKRMKTLTGMMAIACGAMVVVSCSKSDDFGTGDLKQMQTQVYNAAFDEAIGATPAANQDWGFGKFTMSMVTEPEGSPTVIDYVSAARRAVAESVTPVNAVSYQKAEDVLSLEKATCYFYLRIDNKIVEQEMTGVQGNDKNDYYPKEIELATGVDDKLFQKDNEGTLIIAEWEKLGLIKNNNGVTFATVDKPIPLTIFEKSPSFETMASHVPDADKIALAGSVEKFMSDYKIFWYVAKWQAADKKIHIDGVLVKKDQITVNVPEYKKRIIVEDLKGNIKANEKVSSSDFDFNDVVFDAVTWFRDGKQHLKIIVRAAGGRMPIYVQGQEIHQGNVKYMFNTGYNDEKIDYDFGYVLIEDEIIGTSEANTKAFDFNTIPVEIEVNGVKTAAGSNIGEAPEKIAVGLDYKWCKEKNNIKETYPRFVNYVGDKSITNWWKDAE